MDVECYYGYDGRGSVTNLTDCVGMTLDVYQYDPYGQMTLGEPLQKNVYGYNGESYNPNTGLEYLRARYYNVNQGRFFQEDTYLGNLGDPLSLNRYAYVKNSPLNYVDPSGHCGNDIGYFSNAIVNFHSSTSFSSEQRGVVSGNANEESILESKIKRADSNAKINFCDLMPLLKPINDTPIQETPIQLFRENGKLRMELYVDFIGQDLYLEINIHEGQNLF